MSCMEGKSVNRKLYYIIVELSKNHTKYRSVVFVSSTKKVVFISSIILNVLFIGVFAFYATSSSAMKNPLSSKGSSKQSYRDNPYYIERTTLFKQLSIPKESIVFLGDSITQRSEWSELFHNKQIVNRGVADDTTEGVLHRLKSITDAKPKKIFLMIGINDLNEQKSVKKTKANYAEILERIHEETPDTKVYIQSVLPVNNKKCGDAVDNKDVIALNNYLERLAKKHNDSYIDLYSKVSTHNQLKSSFTVDGLHLKGQGYAVWKQEVQSYVNQ